MPERVHQRFDERPDVLDLRSKVSIDAATGHKRKRPSPPVISSVAEQSTDHKEARLNLQTKSLKINCSTTSRHVQPNLRERAVALEKGRKALPIWSHASEIRRGLQEKDVLLIVGETGSGKSTQVPQMLIEEAWCKPQRVVVSNEGGKQSSIEGFKGQNDRTSVLNGKKITQSVTVGGCVAITEPRKVAAISLAERVAKEMGTPLGSSSPGSKVGFSVRFNQSVSPSTRIKFLTEGMLLQEMLRDPWLRDYSAVVLDEVHERGLNVDLLLGFMRQMVRGNCQGRGGIPLKVVIMSATAEMEGLKGFFEEGFKQASLQASGESEHFNSASGIDEGSPVKQSPRAQSDGLSEWSGISSSDSEDEEARNHNINGGGLVDTKTIAPLDRREVETSRQLKPSMAPREGSSAYAFQQKIDLNGGAASDAPRVIFSPVATCYVEGRQYPVTVHYTESPVQNWLDATLRQIFRIHYKEPMPGDILVFLTGQETVESLEKLIQEQETDMPPGVPKLLTLPLFAALPQDAQQAVFRQALPNTRKVILATNIAETSVTVPGVRFVIDCGKAKIKHFRTSIGLESLLVNPISKSAATQRMGRAGREGPGHCWRLYTEANYLALQDSNIPEIVRCDLSQAILTMLARGIGEIWDFPFLDRPRRDAYEKALTHLYQLGALSDSGAINNIGIQMARLPLSASLARTLLAATVPELDCVGEVIDIIACLSVENVFLKTTTEERKEEAEAARKMLYRREGDHLTLWTTVQGYLKENADRKEWCRRCWVSHRAMRAVLVCKPLVLHTILDIPVAAYLPWLFNAYLDTSSAISQIAALSEESMTRFPHGILATSKTPASALLLFPQSFPGLFPYTISTIAVSTELLIFNQ